MIGFVLAGKYLTSPATITPHTTQIDDGQSLQIGVGWSGGAAPYSVYLYSTPSGACTTASTPAGTKVDVTADQYVFTVSPSSTTEYCGQVTSASKSSTLSKTVTVMVSPTLMAPSLTLSTPGDDFGQSLTVSGAVTLRGGAAPYTVTLYTGTSSACASDTTVATVSSGLNPITSLAGTTASFSFASPTFSTYYCVGVTNGVSEAVLSPVVQFVVNPTLAVRIAPSSSAVDMGQSISLSALATGGTLPYTYQWYDGSGCTSAISGQTSAKYSPGVLSATTTYSVGVVDSSTGSPAASVCSTTTVKVSSAFSSNTITLSPPSLGIDQGDTATLSVSWEQGGTTPYTVQILSSYSSSCSGATPVGSNESGLTGTSATFIEYPYTSTYYCAKVTDSASSPEAITTPTASLVTVNPTLAPTVGLSPHSIDTGQTASVAVSVDLTTGTAPYSVTLYSGPTSNCTADTTLVGSGTDVPGPTDTFTVASPSVKTFYCADVTDSAPTPVSAVSPAAEFAINQPVSASVSPKAASVDSGQTASFTVTATLGSPPYTYQWYTGSACSTAISGQTSASYTTGALTASTTYSVEVKDSSPGSPASVSETCKSVTVTVTPAPVPTLALSPGAIDVGQAPSVAANVTWTGGVSPFTVTFYSGSSSTCSSDTTAVAVSAPTNPATKVTTHTEMFSFPAPTAATYYCATVEDNASTPVTAATSVAEFVVNPDLGSSVFSVSPSMIDSGQSTSVSASVFWSGGTAPYTVVLYSGSATACSQDTQVVATTSTSATGVTFTFPSQNSNTYYCANVVDSASTSLESSTSLFTVNPALSISSFTLSANVADSGQSFAITATLTWSGGSSAYTASLYYSASDTCSSPTLVGILSGSNPLTGLGTTTATFSFAAPASARYYCATVKDSSAVAVTLESSALLFSVNTPLTAPGIASSPTTVDSGQSSTLSTPTHFGGGTPSYTCQWLEEAPGASSFSDLGSSFSCTTSSGPSASTGTLSTVGTWRFELEVTDSSGVPESATSGAQSVTVNAALGLSLSLSPSSIDSGQSASITATVKWTGGTSTYTVYLYSGSSSSCSADSVLVSESIGVASSPASFTLSPPSSDTYYCATVTDSASAPQSASTSSGIEFVINPSLLAITPSLSQTVLDAGQSVSVTVTASWSGGEGPYTIALYSSATSTCSASSTLVSVSSASNPLTGQSGTSGTLTFTSPISTTYYCTVVTDSAASPETATSSAARLLINDALTSPTTSGPITVDSGQTAYLSTTAGFGGGTAPFTCQWLQKAPGATSYSDLGSSFTCTSGSLPSVTTGDLSTVGAWHFALLVTDSASTPNSVTSSGGSVTVDTDVVVSALVLTPSSATPGTPVTATMSWSGGTSSYNATLYSGSSSTCADDTQVVAVTSGSNPETGVTGSSASFDFDAPSSGTTYYCVTVVDSSQTPYSASTATVALSVSEAPRSLSLAPLPSVRSSEAFAPSAPVARESLFLTAKAVTWLSAPLAAVESAVSWIRGLL